MRFRGFLKNYFFSLILVGGVLVGAVLGIFLKQDAVALKPFGDIFLNLLFTAVVPLVFFSIASAVAQIHSVGRLRQIFAAMLGIFAVTGVLSSLVMIAAVHFFPPAQGLQLSLPAFVPGEPLSWPAQVVKAFTASDFAEIISKKNMLALIVFSLLIGLATAALKEEANAFREFLSAGNKVMGKVVKFIMWYAPVGLGAYFAYLVGVLGPELLGSYVRAMAIYYPVTLGYFFAGFSLYAYFSGKMPAVKRFWSKIFPAAVTAWATGSSVATIPTNLQAAEEIGVPEDIREVVIPVGATIHMDGTCLSAILKIAVLFGLFGMDFSGPVTWGSAIAVALLSGTVMSGIPGGGFLGEMMIVTLYGFPPEALPVISMIGTLVDPPATMVNSTGDTVASMMITRILGGREWLKRS